MFISDAVAASAVTAAAMFIEYTSDIYVLLVVCFILKKISIWLLCIPTACDVNKLYLFIFKDF